LAWQKPASPETWREHAERAAAAATRMNERDRYLAIALAAMAGKRYPVACDAYRALSRIDSVDFIGWYGQGECQALDGVVQPDASSPSGLKWRSSYDAAVKAFARALRLEPGAHALLSFERLRRLLPTAGVHVRADDRTNPNFAAYPSLSGDTIAFVPYPLAVFAKGLPAEATSTLNQALNRNVETLYELTTNWVRVAPQSPDAYESLAEILETRGNIFGAPASPGSAMAAVNQALALSTNPQQRLRLAARSAGLRFKRGDFAGAREVADSLIRAPNLVDANEPPVLISLTALTGRVENTARLARAGVIPEQVDGVAVPIPLAEAAASLFANAAMGVCGDTIARLKTRVEQQIESSIPEGARNRVRAALTTRALSMMVPCTNGASALEIDRPSTALYRLQHAFARRDLAAVRTRLVEVAAAQRALRPTDLSIDYIFQESWVRAATGDTAGAISRLDRSLNSIATWSALAWREPGASAAVGRAMALRAELAARTGDIPKAQRWAKALTELWASADPPLRRTASEIRTLAQLR
jgi:tetratricopeptide (TPR) repeat protein